MSKSSRHWRQRSPHDLAPSLWQPFEDAAAKAKAEYIAKYGKEARKKRMEV